MTVSPLLEHPGKNQDLKLATRLGQRGMQIWGWEHLWSLVLIPSYLAGLHLSQHAQSMVLNPGDTCPCTPLSIQPIPEHGLPDRHCSRNRGWGSEQPRPHPELIMREKVTHYLKSRQDNTHWYKREARYITWPLDPPTDSSKQIPTSDTFAQATTQKA